jgi:hypothetical protein
MRRRAALGFAGIALAASACRLVTAPPLPVDTTIEISRSATAPADTLTLTAIATNHGGDRLEIGHGCGAGLDFEVTTPSGGRAYVLRDLPSICPVFDSNVLEAGETDTVRVKWTAPGTLGTYRIRAGVRTAAGIGAPSAAVSLDVR